MRRNGDDKRAAVRLSERLVGRVGPFKDQVGQPLTTRLDALEVPPGNSGFLLAPPAKVGKRSIYTGTGKDAAKEIKEWQAIMDHIRSLPVKAKGELPVSPRMRAPAKCERSRRTEADRCRPAHVALLSNFCHACADGLLRLHPQQRCCWSHRDAASSLFSYGAASAFPSMARLTARLRRCKVLFSRWFCSQLAGHRPALPTKPTCTTG